MARQLSTAISDFVLSITTFYGAGIVYYNYAAIGLFLIGLAAGVGVIRFLNVAPLHRRNTVIEIHTKLAWFATILGIPLIAASFCLRYRAHTGSQIHIVSAIAGIMFSHILPKFKDSCTHFVSTFAILSILFQSFQANNVLAMAGAILYVISGTLVGTSGYMMGYLCIDIFHYCLVAGNIAFVRALQ